MITETFRMYMTIKLTSVSKTRANEEHGMLRYHYTDHISDDVKDVTESQSP